MPRPSSVSVMANKRTPGPRATIVIDEQGARKVHLRRTHKKSHLGCQTCKQRRIKCDEKLPCCSQCKRAKLCCPYEKYTPDQMKEHEYKRQQALDQAEAAATQTTTKDTTMTSPSSEPVRLDPIETMDSSNLENTNDPQPTVTSSYSQVPTFNVPPTIHGTTMPPPRNISSIPPTTITASFAPLPPDQIARHPHYDTYNGATETSSHTDLVDINTNQSTGFSSVSSVDHISSNIPPYSQHSHNLDNNRGNLYINNTISQPSHYNHNPQLSQSQKPHHNHFSQIDDFQHNQTKIGLSNSLQQIHPGSHFNFYNNGIPNIARINEVTDLQRRNLLSTVNLVRQGFETEMMRGAYSNWMSNTMALAYHHECLFHSVMAFSFGFQALKTGNQYYRNLSDNHRVLALKKFNTELENVSPANTDALLGTSLILYWDAMYQVDTIYSYINMCRGLGAILEKVQINSSITQTAICTTESLAQAIKSILFPRYPHYFFQELIDSIALLEPLMTSDNADTQKEYYYLRDYTYRVYGFIRSGTPSTQNSIYDPNVLYDFIKEWISNFPCLSFSLDFVRSDACIVLYTFFDAVSHALDAIFPEARYLFQFSFIGPIDLIGVENAALIVYTQEAFVHLEYPLRMISFFKKRAYQLSGLFMTSDPLLMSPSGIPLYRSRQNNMVSEKFVQTFSGDQLNNGFEEFMPTLNPKVHSYMDLSKPPLPSSSNDGIGFGQGNNNSSLPPLFSDKNTKGPEPLVNTSSSANHDTLDSQMTIDADKNSANLSSQDFPSNNQDVEMSSLPSQSGRQSSEGSQSNSSDPSSSNIPQMPVLSSLSLGSFKTYFDDRLDILRHFTPNQPDIY